MKATINKQTQPCKIAENRKENNFMTQYTAIDGDLNEIAILRIYGTTRANYACFWLFNGDYNSGGARATGYGYHRPSAAAQFAFNRAGIVLSEAIDGRGDRAMIDALEAIAKAATGKRKIKVLTANA